MVKVLVVLLVLVLLLLLLLLVSTPTRLWYRMVEFARQAAR
jgi:hypothetical protein